MMANLPYVVVSETAMVENIEQTMWATDSVKENNPQEYEEGYEYFNAVLTDIPEEHYDKVIVARSYVCIDGQYYYADVMERSIAQVSAYAIQDGYTEEMLVSSDVIGCTYGSLFDATQTMVTPVEEGLYQVQVVAWYDNENSYTSQMVKTIKYFAEL